MNTRQLLALWIGVLLAGTLVATPPTVQHHYEVANQYKHLSAQVSDSDGFTTSTDAPLLIGRLFVVCALTGAAVLSLADRRRKREV